MKLHKLTILVLVLIITNCTLKPIAGIEKINSPEVGILRIGFDIDDTVLFSKLNFEKAPKSNDNSDHVDFTWINQHDKEYSTLIQPIAELINFYRHQGHEIFFITARPATKDETVGDFLTEILGFPIKEGINMFFESKAKSEITGKRHTTKHLRIKDLELDMFVGDSDTDIIAGIKAGVHTVRVLRNPASVESYSRNYFGDTKKGEPINIEWFNKFVSTGVGPYGETILPLYDINN
jgi:acid phosphatase class B